MSTQKTSDASVDEMDLTDIFSLFRRWFYWFLVLCFKAVDFILKFWWVILILIALGVAAGKFTSSKTKYQSTIIVQTNFESQPYVYNAVGQFDRNISDQDIPFMQDLGLNVGDPEIIGASISPIVDVVSLLEEMGRSDGRSLTTIIKELSVDDDTELFASDRFYTNYKFHKLEINLLTEDGEKAIQSFLDYINDQPQIQTIKEGRVQNLEKRIAENERMLTQIDTLIASYSKNIVTSKKTAENLSFYNNQNNLNINGALELKNTIAQETEELKNQQITYSDAMVVISDIQMIKDVSLRDKKYIIYPVLFVMIFLFIAGVRYTYNTLRSQLVEEKLLD